MPVPIARLRQPLALAAIVALPLWLGGCPQPASNVITPFGLVPTGSVGGGAGTNTAGDNVGIPVSNTGADGIADVLAGNFPGCRPAANADSLRAEILLLVNQERAAAGLSPLRRNATLEAQAEQYACELIHYDFFAHDNPVTGSTLAVRAREFGYAYLYIGENLAGGQRTAAGVMEDWMNSPGHRENILNPRFVELGVGVRTGGDYGIYWVQEFGEPAPIAPAN